MGGTSMEVMRGACFAGSSPPFLGRERAAIDVERDVGLYSEYRDATHGGCSTEVTVTSKLHAHAERAKKEKREEKAASIGGAGRDP